MQDNDWTSSIISFESSGVVFGKEDCLIVITPTLMTWKDNDQISEQDLLDALTLASKDKESGTWSPCNYSDDKFYGVIGINEKDLNARIVVAYVLEHFSDFKLAIAVLFFASLAIGFRPVFPHNNKVKKTNYIADVSLSSLSCLLLLLILNTFCNFGLIDIRKNDFRGCILWVMRYIRNMYVSLTYFYFYSNK